MRLTTRERCALILLADGVQAPCTVNLKRKGLVYRTGMEIVDICDQSGEVIGAQKFEEFGLTLRGRRAVKHWRQMPSRASWFHRVTFTS
jgi:hypothetical protein